MKLKRTVICGLLLGLTTLALAACGDPTATTTTTAATPARATVAATTSATTGADRTKKVEALKLLGTNLTATSEALKKNDLVAAKAAFTKFKAGWDDVEDSIKDKSADLYKDIEDNLGKLDRSLLRSDKPVVGEVQPAFDVLQEKYTTGIKMVEAG